MPGSNDRDSLFVNARSVTAHSPSVLSAVATAEDYSKEENVADRPARNSEVVLSQSVSHSPVPPQLAPVFERSVPVSGLGAEQPAEQDKPLTVTDVYDQTADFVWRSLQRLGVPQADLEDVLQEVFVVVHKKLRTYDHRCKLTTWVFGITMRVASRQRQRAYVRREALTDAIPERAGSETPEQHATRRQAIRQLSEVLSRLSEEKRATFVMFELERLSCEEIAEITDVPVGTVYSRLHAARREFTAAVERLHMRQESTAAAARRVGGTK